MTQYEVVGAWNTNVGSSALTVWPSQQYDRVHYYWYPCTCHTKIVAEKVSLTLDEIDQLRAAAKADPNLRAALNKMARLIDIEVSF